MEGAPVNGVAEATPKNKDGLLSQDHEELCERVSYLEKKVQQQEDEIVCLKSAIADVIRRLGQAEAGRDGKKNDKKIAAQNSILPSKPAFRSPRTKSSRSHVSPLDNANVTPARSSTPPMSSRTVSSPRTHSAHMKKWASNSADVGGSQHGGHGSSSVRRSVSQTNLMMRISHRGVKDPVWNTEEGYMKIYMRGRAVNMYAPSSITDFDISHVGDYPEEKLKLEWVYGYRGRDCRCNLYYLPTGEIVYFSAAVVVLHNLEENIQRHYLGHTDDVKCLTLHPDKIRVASGQVAGHGTSGKKKGGKKNEMAAEEKDNLPHIRVWDSITLETIHVIGIGVFDRAVCCISFSKVDNGEHLVAVDDANEHVISVWDLTKEKASKITETKSSTEPVLAVEYHPSEKNSIVSCGKNQITFWTMESGSLARKQGIFEKYVKPKYILCLAFADNGDVISGDSNGSIFVWEKGSNKISQAITDAHAGGVFSLCMMKDDCLVSGGGKDRKIIKWDNYKATGVTKEIAEMYGGIRMLSQGKGGLLLVGTTRNCILKGGLDINLEAVVQGHMDELWGLAPHPSQLQFMTCGSDKRVQLWDSMTRSVIWSKEVSDPAHSCHFHPDGSVAAIGTETGRWYVLDLGTHEIITTHTDGNEQIETVQFSPDGHYLALGSRDNRIYVYEVNEDKQKYTRIGVCSGHSSFVTHLDWSCDSHYIVTNSGDYEILYWSVPSCKQVTSAASLKDVEWATQNCTLSFNAAGIWPEGADGTDVNNCCRSNAQTLMASADDFGKVNLFKYPTCQPKSNGRAFSGHSSHVTSVAFLHDDTRLISCGGRDMSVLQWQVTL